MIIAFLKGVKRFLSGIRKAFNKFLETKSSRKLVSLLFTALAILSLIASLWFEKEGVWGFFFSETALIAYLIIYALALFKFSFSWHIEEAEKYGFRIVGLVLLAVALIPFIINLELLRFMPIVFDLSLNIFNALSFSLLLLAAGIYGWMD